MDASKLVVLATFNNPHEANLLRLRLENCGIESVVANENTSTLFGATLAGPSSAFWIEVLVRSEDAESALPIREAFHAEKSVADEVINEWQCACGETVDAGFGICWNCGSEFSADLQ